MTAEFQRQLDLLRSSMADALSARRRMTVPELPKPYRMPYPDFPLHQSTVDLLMHLDHVVTEDIERYQPHTTAPLPASTLAEGTAEATPTATQTVPSMTNPPEGGIPQEAPTPVAPDPAHTGLPSLFRKEDITSPFLTLPATIDLDPSVIAELDAPTLRLYSLLFREVNEASMNLSNWGIALPSLQRIKKALHSLVQNKIGDTILILRNGRKDDPNNKLMAFVLSQVLYFRCQEGHSEFLPEAREEAKKSCSFDERYPQYKLIFFRYQHVATEMALSKERAQELLREYYLIGSDTLLGDEGLKAQNWHHLKALLLLSKVPSDFWSTYEIDCIHTVTEQAIGGGLIYLKFFRLLVLQKLAVESQEYDRFNETEATLRLIYLRHHAAIENITSHFNKEGTLLDPPQSLWTVASRYVQTFLEKTPLPTFENLLANTSLDGRRSNTAEKIDAKLHDAGLHDVSFWTTWIMKTSAHGSIYNDGAIPDYTVRQEAGILKQFDRLLELLKAWEEPIVSDEKWEKAKIYLAPLQHNKLLELGTGQPLGALAFGSGDAIYKNYYKGWSSLIEDDILSSDNIRKRAKAGVFWSIEEIMATFDGAQRIMEDPMVGLQARVRIGYRKFVQNRSKSNTAGRGWQEVGNESFTEHFKEFWWLYTILVPLSFMTFIVIVSSRSYQNAIQMILVMVGFAFVGFLVFSQVIKKQPPKQKPKSPKSHDAPRGDSSGV